MTVSSSGAAGRQARCRCARATASRWAELNLRRASPYTSSTAAMPPSADATASANRAARLAGAASPRSTTLPDPAAAWPGAVMPSGRRVELRPGRCPGVLVGIAPDHCERGCQYTLSAGAFIGSNCPAHASMRRHRAAAALPLLSDGLLRMHLFGRASVTTQLPCISTRSMQMSCMQVPCGQYSDCRCVDQRVSNVCICAPCATSASAPFAAASRQSVLCSGSPRTVFVQRPPLFIPREPTSAAMGSQSGKGSVATVCWRPNDLSCRGGHDRHRLCPVVENAADTCCWLRGDLQRAPCVAPNLPSTQLLDFGCAR